MIRFPTAVTLRQIQYFLAAAEQLHFTRAAEAMAVTQPTLSHQIAQLETQIGHPLFDRIGKRVRLTEAGVLLRRYADRAIRELESGSFALSELEGLQRGELRIGVIQSFSRTLLPTILGRFMTLYPDIRLDIRELTGIEIETDLAHGRIDLGIAFAPTALDGTDVEPVLEERLLVVVGKQNIFAKRRQVKLSELHDKPMALLGSNFSTRQLIDRYFESANVRPQVVCETNSMEIMLGAVAESVAATIIPEHALRREYPHIRAIPLINPVPMRTSALLWPRHSFRSISARAFAQMMRDRFLGADSAYPAAGGRRLARTGPKVSTRRTSAGRLEEATQPREHR